MITIEAIKAFHDNYIWAIINSEKNEAIVIDPGQGEPVQKFLLENELTLSQIWITHRHPDHIGGVSYLQEKFPNVHLVAHEKHGVSQMQTVIEGSEVATWETPSIEGRTEVWHIAGHTENHLAYLLFMNDNWHVFCGDTLFSAGCGRVFTGNMQEMYASLQRLSGLPEHTLFYPAHEYTASNLKFGLHIEPDNQAIKQRLAEVKDLNARGKPSLPTSLTQEKQINVFLRVTEDAIIQSLQTKIELANHQPVTVFAGLRALKDSF